MTRRTLKKDFWHPVPGREDTNLYDDDLGWKESNRTDAHSTDSWNILKFYLDHYGFDLALYLVETDEFYYIDNMQNNEVLKLKDREDWDGHYIAERVEFSHMPNPEPEVIYEYNDLRDLWNNLKIHNMSLKEVIEKSVVFVTT